MSLTGGNPTTPIGAKEEGCYSYCSPGGKGISQGLAARRHGCSSGCCSTKYDYEWSKEEEDKSLRKSSHLRDHHRITIDDKRAERSSRKSRATCMHMYGWEQDLPVLADYCLLAS